MERTNEPVAFRGIVSAAWAAVLALRPVFAELASLSANKAAAELNARKVETPTGSRWSAQTVIRVRDRLAA